MVQKIKSYLKQEGFRFRDADISKDPKAAQDVVRKMRQTGVLVILIDNRPVNDFNKVESTES
jgi:glutaredoxin 3